MKDYEHRLLEQRQRNLNGQVHHLEEPSDLFSQDDPPDDHETADQVVNACLIELNLLETPQNTASWYLDSGATHHVSGEKSAFTSIRSTSGAQVKSAGGHSHSVAGVGNVALQLSSGEIKSINSVLYAPGITKNLLSVGALADQHKTLVFKSDGCFVFNNSNLQLEAFASREHGQGLYRLSNLCQLQHSEVNLVQRHSSTDLWHKRLGHFHAKGMQRMLNFGAVRGLPALHFSRQVCTGCQLGKQTRTKLPKEATFNATKILQLVHSDVCGPFRTTSLGGARYFVTFIDDFSRKTWIYFLAHKSQVLTKFQHLVNFLKTSTGQCIQTLRSDNGGKYTSSAFRDYCLNEGIAREFAPPYTPQRNGVAERRNRSLLNITRCLLLDKGLPGHLWGEAVKAAGDLLNLRSTKRHPDKTPEEFFSGKKPSISHLKFFGSPVYVRTIKPSQSKLDPRSERCILLSFDSGNKAYRCYRPSTKKVFISRDVLVDETSSLEFTSSSVREDVPLDSTPAPTRQEERLALLDPDTPPHFDVPASTFDDSAPSFDDPASSFNDHVSPSRAQNSSPTFSPLHPSQQSSPAVSLHPSPPTAPAPPRRSERVRRFPKHLHDFAAHIQLQILPNALAAQLQNLPEVFEDSPEFLTFQQAHLNPHWKSAMQTEMDSIHQNHTWSLVPLPPDKKAISSKWVYKIKLATTGNPTRYKARLVARGFEQKDGVDFLETFAPVVRWETIRVLIAIALHLNWPLHQLDVLTAFLNGILREDVYMHQPHGFVKPGEEHLVCKLHKALYGLKQSPRAWYARLHAALLAWGLIQSLSDPNLYFAHIGSHTVALLVYVDDILLTGSDSKLIAQLKTHLQQQFKTNDLGPISRYLGVQFDRTATGLHMHQRQYALSILQLFQMEDCKPSLTPLPKGLSLSKNSDTPPVDATLYRMLVGKLLFLTKTRPDLTHAVSVVSRFMQNPQEAHLQAAKHILRYVRRYPDLGLFFKQGEENRLHGYTDADYGQDIDDRISVGAYIFFLGTSPISWNSKKQSSTSRSSCESEYRALAQCSCEAIWLRRLLKELRILDDKPTYLYCDNQSSIKLSYNPVFHERSKHFEIDFHYTRQKVENNTIKVEYIPSQEQPADILTKSLGRIKFENCRDKLHLCNQPSQNLTAGRG
jgi:transposase InsO family protein